MSDRVKTKMNQNQMPSLESVTSSIPIPWNECIEIILSRPYPWRSLPRKPNEGELALIWCRLYAWEIALHWVIRKEWNKKHKIPAKRSLAKMYEPKGEFLRHMLLLCDRCHAMQEAVKVDIPYDDAALWFASVFWELIVDEMVTVLISPEQIKPINKPRNLRGQNPAHRQKRNQIQAEMHEFLQLQNYKNPVEDKQSAVSLLFNAAIAQAEKSSMFRTKYWKPFLLAGKAQVQVKETPQWGRVVREDNSVYVQMGKGKGKRILPEPPESVKKLIFETFA